ncbi:hypothetical protein D3C87_1326840 [compost metagenome]
MVIFTILLSVRHCDLNIVPFQVDDRVTHALHICMFVQQVVQPPFRKVFLVVKVDGKPCIQEHIVPDHAFHKIRDIMVISENGFVGVKSNCSTIALRGINYRVIGYDFPLREFYFLGFCLTVRLYHKIGRQGIYSLGTYPVQTYRFLEGLTVILTPGINFRNTIYHLTQWDTPSIITNIHFLVRNGNFNGTARAHYKLVNGVVYDLFEQYINPVILGRAVAQFSDIHTGT